MLPQQLQPTPVGFSISDKISFALNRELRAMAGDAEHY
jgi:hypothetical protein